MSGRPTAAVASAPTARGAGPAVVLVVDDSPDDRFATARALRRAGLTVWEEATGEGGLRRAGERPDLVILDVNLPDVSGFEVCRRMKADPRTAMVPVLHLSGAQIDASARVHGLDSGADAYLTHPVEPGVLVATARALLRLHRAEAALRGALDRAGVLSRLNARFSDARTPAQVLAVLADHGRRELGARTTTMYGLDRETATLLLLQSTAAPGIVARYSQVTLQDELPSAVVARTGEPLFGASAAELETRFPHLGAAYRATGGGGWAAVPLLSYGELLGVLVLSFLDEQDFPPERRELLVALGERCGQALERAQLHDQQRQIATTLQSSLLPGALPEIPGITLGARYVSGAAGTTVGGDFYDVFGREEDWIATVGDVCGRGAEAASLTGLARHTIRAEARHRQDPGAILTALNAAAKRRDTNPHQRFLTAVCLSLRPDDTGATAVIATGGHPPPMIARRGGGAEVLPRGGPAIGIMDVAGFGQVEKRLAPGETLVLYTDGVIEARRGGEQWGLARLESLLGALAAEGPEPQAIADAIVDAAERHGGTIADDMAILALQVS